MTSVHQEAGCKCAHLIRRKTGLNALNIFSLISFLNSNQIVPISTVFVITL